MEANDVLDRLERMLAHEAQAENVDEHGKALDHLADAFVTAGPALIRLARAALATASQSEWVGDDDLDAIERLEAAIKALGEVRL